MTLADTFPDIIYETETDDYLSGFDHIPTHSFPEEYAKRPAEGTEQMLDLIAERMHHMEVDRRLIEGKVSVLYELLAKYPETIERLSHERRVQVQELVGRLMLTNDK